MSIIEVNNLNKSFKVGKESVKVLKNINFNVEKGEFYFNYGTIWWG